MGSPRQPYALRDAIDATGSWQLTTYLELADGSALLRASVESWAVRVFDAQSVSEDVAVWELLAQSPSASNDDGSAIWPTSVIVNGLSPTPRGHTLALQLNPTLWDAATGRTYTAQVSASLDTAAGGGEVTIRALAYVRPAL